MNKKSQVFVIVVILIIIAVVLAYFFLNKSVVGGGKITDDSEEVNGVIKVITEKENKMEENQEINNENTIEITSSGFSPRSLTISQGELVTFINKGSDSSWPASAAHPTHLVYPEKTGKCALIGGSDFDACRGLKQRESYSFTFNEKGSWKYHDHLNPKLFGEIIVE